MPDSAVEATARSYVQAVGAHDLAALGHLLDDGLSATFGGGDFVMGDILGFLASGIVVYLGWNALRDLK